MKRLATYLVELGGSLALLLTVALAVIILAALGGSISALEVLNALLKYPGLGTLVAVMLLMIAVYFGVRVVHAHRQRRLIIHAGTRGDIRISSEAVREFIAQVLEEELGLSQSRVRLKPGSGEEACLVVSVRVSLPLGENIVEAGERIQELLKARVEDRIGIRVERVEVYTSSIRSTEASRMQPSHSKRTYITSFREGEFEGDFRE